MVQAKSLETQQRLEQEKLRLQQEETRAMLEMEIAKTVAKEKALTALQVSQPGRLYIGRCNDYGRADRRVMRGFGN